MKRILATLLLLVPATAFGEARDISQSQKNIQAPLVRMAQPLQFCGELTNASPTGHIGAAGLDLSGVFTVDHQLASLTCDALGTTSFAGSDYVVSELDWTAVGMWCRITAATTTTALTTAYLATSAGDSALSCEIPIGGHECASQPGVRVPVAGDAAVAIRIYNGTDNLSTSDALCYLYINW